MQYPEYRPRRLRRNETLRRMVRETKLSVDDLIYPLFAAAGKGIRTEVSSMPGVFQLSVENLAKEAREVAALGIPAVLLFGLPAKKDPLGKDAYSDRGSSRQRCGRSRTRSPASWWSPTSASASTPTTATADPERKRGRQRRDARDPREERRFAREGGGGHRRPLRHDGRAGRRDPEGAGSRRIFAGPHHVVRGEVRRRVLRTVPGRRGERPQLRDRRSYQMDPPNAREALREVALDVAEGADIVMVKPALAYLDVICRVRQAFNLPVAAYNVSGEYAMVKAAAKLGWIDGDRVTMEILVSIKRAGADLIITYAAKEAARALAG